VINKCESCKGLGKIETREKYHDKNEPVYLTYRCSEYKGHGKRLG
jgi:hypothetical protein